MIRRITLLALLLALASGVAHAWLAQVPAAGGGVNNILLDGSAAPVTLLVSNPITTSAGGVVCVAVFADAAITAVADTASLTWASKGATDNGASYHMSLWCAPHASALSGDVITATAGGSSFGYTVPFSFKNTNATPFDANGALPGLQTGGAGGHVFVTTTSANDVLIGVYGGSLSFTAGTGWTQIQDSSGFMLIEYKLVTATQSALDVTIGTSDGSNSQGIGQAMVSN